MVSNNVLLESIYKYSLYYHKKNYFHQNMHNPQKSQIESRRGAVPLHFGGVTTTAACYRMCYR